MVAVGRQEAVADQRRLVEMDRPDVVAVDERLILRYTPAKTQFTSGAKVVLDLRELSMVMEDRQPVAQGGKLTGISKEVWNRDARAGGVTEEGQAAVPTDDLAKTAGHNNKRTPARVYDRARLEAARRAARAGRLSRPEPTVTGVCRMCRTLQTDSNA